MKNCKGNVLVYILLAVALLAALAYAISGDSRGQQTTQLDSAKAKLLATDLIKHAVAAEQGVYMMTQFGTNFDEVRFDIPPLTNIGDQVYHPSGGGLQIFQTNDNHFDGVGTTGWQWQGNVNVGWSGVGGTDLIYTFINVNNAVCEQLNNQLVGNTTIPTATVDFTNTFTESATDDPFIATECAACEGVKSLCITDGTTNAFYTTVGMR